MRFTVEGKELLKISEDNLGNLPEVDGKVHLIELDFRVNQENYNEIRKIVWTIFNTYKSTKRYIVYGYEDEVKYWNKIFKTLKSQYRRYKWVFYKKFYIANVEDSNLFYFFKRHNKVLLNIRILSEETLKCVEQGLEGILAFTEIIKGNAEFYERNKDLLLDWNGNYIITKEDYEKFVNKTEK